MDTVPRGERSRIMRAVPRKDTAPEVRVRKMAHKLGLRFRLHRKDLPGSPDLVFPKYRLCLFVHGCFWHRHPGCKKATTPKSNAAFWTEKFAKNIERDRRQVEELMALGWRVGIIWECQTQNDYQLEHALMSVIGPRFRGRSACFDSPPPEGHRCARPSMSFG